MSSLITAPPLTGHSPRSVTMLCDCRMAGYRVAAPGCLVLSLSTGSATRAALNLRAVFLEPIEDVQRFRNLMAGAALHAVRLAGDAHEHTLNFQKF